MNATSYLAIHQGDICERGSLQEQVSNNKIEKDADSEGMTLFGEISAVADVHDAMISDRVYRQGYPPDVVIKFLKTSAGTNLNR